MVDKGNLKKAEQLGMPFGTANAILRKKILFSLIQKSNLDICYRCGNKIENIEEFSVEHILPWLDTENPSELFFNLDNIAYSHIKCNIGAIRRKYRLENAEKVRIFNTRKCPDGMAYCWHCKEFKDKSCFNKKKTRHNGVNDECKECKKKRRKKI